jgi:predicted nucleic acid-binding protein
MRSRVTLDTGPLVALLNRSDHHHPWARACFAETASPLRICEAVISEAWFLVRSLPRGPRTVIDLLE